jgi:hypothetical protein
LVVIHVRIRRVDRVIVADLGHESSYRSTGVVTSAGSVMATTDISRCPPPPWCP